MACSAEKFEFFGFNGLTLGTRRGENFPKMCGKSFFTFDEGQKRTVLGFQFKAFSSHSLCRGS